MSQAAWDIDWRLADSCSLAGTAVARFDLNTVEHWLPVAPLAHCRAEDPAVNWAQRFPVAVAAALVVECLPWAVAY